MCDVVVGQLHKLAAMTQVSEQTVERLPESIDTFLQPTDVTDVKGELTVARNS